MRRGLATVAAVALTAIASLAAVAVADGESLELSLPVSAHVDAFYVITAEGMADGAHRLFVYVDPGGAECAMTPDAERKEFTDAIAIFGPEGVALESGPFVRADHGFAPPEDDDYSVCGYLDAAPEDAADAVAEGRFAVPSGPVGEGEHVVGEDSEELRRLAAERERESEEQRAAAREREEREAREAAALRFIGTLQAPPAEQLPPAARAPVATPAVVHCIVPALRGHSLAWTRRALAHAHCSLGRVRPAAATRGSLVVVRQDVRRGTSLRDGAPVGVALGHPRR